MFDPEVADAFVAVRQRLVAALRVREAGAVEVQFHVVGFRPVDPTLEVFRFDLIAVYLLTAEVAVDGVDVQTVITRQQAFHLFDVFAHFFDVAGFAGIVAGSLNTARKLAVRVFETGYVVRLPAVQRQGYFGDLFQYGVGIDTDFGIACFGGLVGLLDFCVFHGFCFKLKSIE